MGRKEAAGERLPARKGDPSGRGKSEVPSTEGDYEVEDEEPGEFEGALLDVDGGGRQHGRRRVARGLEDRDSSDLPDEPPPGYPG